MTENVKDHVVYLHGSKDSNWESWRELGGDPETDAASTFAYTGYEIGLQCMVDMSTGEAMAYGIRDGDELVEFDRPVRI